jgi:uncharacterized oxidoreductase
MNIKKNRIIITGGTSSIDYQMTKYLHSDNDIVVISRSASKLNKLAQNFEGVITYQADLFKLDEAEAVTDTIVKRFKSIDLLINNTAVQHTPTFLDDEFKYENIVHETTLNITSACSFIYLLLPALLHQNKAVILNVNSALSLAPKTSSAIYCATKGALNILSQSLRYQLEKINISIQQVFFELVGHIDDKRQG